MTQRTVASCRQENCRLPAFANGLCLHHFRLANKRNASPYAGRPSAHERGYGAAWHKYRRRFLMEHPLCTMHFALGELVPATVVDHITPHKGDSDLFWQASNHQALCKHCHDSHKQRLEKSGTVLGCTEKGAPIDPNHHWNQPR